MLTVYIFGHNKKLLDCFDNGTTHRDNTDEKQQQQPTNPTNKPDHKIDDRIALAIRI